MESSATIWHFLISNSSIQGTARTITENHCVRMTGSCMHRWGILLLLHQQSPECPPVTFGELRTGLILKTSWIDMPATLGCDTASRSLQGYWPL